jgi:hypothetical protein
VYVAQQKARISYGLSVRGTAVSYHQLLRNNAAIEPSNRFFLEPTGFIRVGQGPVQGMATIGVSLPGSPNRQNLDQIRLSPSTSLISLGVVLRPHLLGRPQAGSMH